jgi:hypothetical protein
MNAVTLKHIKLLQCSGQRLNRHAANHIKQKVLESNFANLSFYQVDGQ